MSAAANDEGRLLSSLTDGDVDADGLARACQAWRDSASARSTWHAYQLIGDVLRSDDLSATPVQDEAFLRSLRERLAAEPVVLAPMPPDIVPPAANAGAAHRHGWLAPVAVAAGFAAVAGVLVVSRLSGPTPLAPDVTLASGAASATAAGPQRARLPGEPAALIVADHQLVRDARLDSYFEAHRGAFGANALGVPGGAMRSAETLLPQR